MGWVGRVLSFTRRSRNGEAFSEVKGDPAGGNNQTAPHFGAPGDDGRPLAGDLFAAVRVEGTGRTAAVGYVDPNNNQTAGPGERRIYARDANGAEVAQVWARADGSLVLNNGAGAIVLDAGGTISLNGVEIDPAGNITAPGDADFTGALTADSVEADTIEALTSLIAAGLELVLHTHLAGTPPGNTGPNQ